MPRRVTVVLTSAEGAPPLVMEPFDVETPWWPDVEPVVAEAARRIGSNVSVLRLLDATPGERDPSGMGGAATYLAEVDSEAHHRLSSRGAFDSWSGALDDHPLRASWARPGGPAAHLAWADGALAERSRPRTGPAVQIKSWNLSGIWRLPTASGPVWLKTVPPFFSHEGHVIAALGEAPVPPLLAADTGRLLLDDVPGEDQWLAAPPVLLAMVTLLVDLQFTWIGRIRALLDLGVADFRATALATAATVTFERSAGQLTGADRQGLHALIGGLDQRFAAIEACGLPDTLVHGDLHPGNVRGRPASLTILDWGDCGVGHPLLDLDAMLARVTDPDVVRSAWCARWRDLMPGTDPLRAATLVAPVGGLRRAVVYQQFLDGIEPSERRYHDTDVTTQLRRAAAAYRAEEPHRLT